MSSSNVAIGSDPRLRLGAALLIHHGEISLAEIEALPFVGSPAVAEMLAIELTNRLGAERLQRRALGSGLNRWEDVIYLRQQATTGARPTRRCT